MIFMGSNDSYFTLNDKESTKSVHPVRNYEITNKYEIQTTEPTENFLFLTSVEKVQRIKKKNC